ncbi:MAG: sporulation integral membrane protein YtvI [Roseburia sp.]|jgi:sporulation integral membrane protein YtvI|nr:sporulation integral membrane protein YtvI [Roseburia sp.]
MKRSVKYLKIFCNLLLAAGIALFFIYILPGLLGYFMPFVFGFVFSLIANPVVRFLEKRIRIKRKYGSVLIIILVIGTIVLICYGVFTVLAAGLRSFADYVPTMYANAAAELSSAAEHLQELLHRFPLTQNIDLDKTGAMIGEYMAELIPNETSVLVIGDVAKRIPDVLVGLIVGLLATYFFIADRDRLVGFIDRWAPQSVRTYTGRIYGQIRRVVGGYFKAQLQIMMVIYAVVLTGLVLLDVRYAWLIGFGIAFLDMLPVFGTGTVLCPWAVIKLFSGNYATAAGMFALYAVTLVVHQLVQPKLVGDSVGMDPFAALFFMFVGYRISNVTGMILAIPAGMILINLWQAGAFDTLIWCVREIIKDFNEFRKIPKDQRGQGG